jgi:hypothetical protein
MSPQVKATTEDESAGYGVPQACKYLQLPSSPRIPLLARDSQVILERWSSSGRPLSTHPWHMRATVRKVPETLPLESIVGLAVDLQLLMDERR